MSVNGPSNLGTLLVQRIDSMLGNTIGQQSNLATGARPDAVTQPGMPDRPDPTRSEPQRSGQEVVDRSRAQQEQQAKQPSVQRGRVDARTAELLAQRSPASTETTQSAPTRLGFAAQTILSLLAAMPDQSPVVQGRKPLLNFGPDPGKGGNGGANAANGAAAAGRGAAGGAGGTAAGNAALAGGAAGTAAGAAAMAADADGTDPNAALRGTTTAGSGGAGGAQGAATAGQTGVANTAQQTQAGQNQPGSAANAAANVRGTLLTGTNPIATQLGQALTQAVQGSGMFYESHLGNLAFGRGALPQILQEPQAQLNQTTQQTGAGSGNAASGSGSAAAGAAGSGATPGGGTGAAPGTAGGTAAGGTTAGASAGGASGSAGVSGSTGAAGTASAAGTAASSGTGGAGGTSTQTSLTLAGVDPQTHTLVRQQLDVLANQSFAWRGEVWPNADMDWEVARRDASRDLDGTEYPDHWASRLKVNLPMLGEVEARITLVGQQLIMHLVAPHSSDVLNTHANDLRGRISAQGLHLGQLSVVARDPHAGDEDLPAAVIDDIKEAQAAANQALAGFELAEGAAPAAEGIPPRETP